MGLIVNYPACCASLLCFLLPSQIGGRREHADANKERGAVGKALSPLSFASGLCSPELWSSLGLMLWFTQLLRPSSLKMMCQNLASMSSGAWFPSRYVWPRGPVSGRPGWGTVLIQSSCKQLRHFLSLLRIQAFFLSQRCFAFGNLPGVHSISAPVGLLCVGNKAHSSALSI